MTAQPPDPRLLNRQLLLFFALAYAISWLFFIPLGLSRTGLGWISFDLSLPVMTVLGTTGPSLAALLTLRITEHRWPIISRFTLKAALVSFLLSPLLIMTTFAILPALFLTTDRWATLHWSSLLSLSVFNISTLIGGPLCEEPGWRGFALPRLQTRFGPVVASFLLGTLWACWHLPIFLTKSWTSANFPTYLLIVTGLCFSMTFLFNLSGGSVVTAIASHAFFNTVSRWLAGLLGDAKLRSTPSPEVTLGLAAWAVALLILVLTRGRLGLPSDKRIV